MTTPFVPTHRLRNDIPELDLKAGTLLRQINPFAGERPDDHLMMLEEHNHPSDYWIFLPQEVEALPEWPAIREEMFDWIGERARWSRTLI